MIEHLQDYFGAKGSKFCKHLQSNVTAIMQCGKANTYSMARQLSKTNNKTFKTNEMAVYRFLQDDQFQIDDSFWRCHINLLFDLLKENEVIKIGDKIQINVDYTTHEDNFLILSASVLLYDKAITVFFTSRKYPKKKGQLSCKKMEEAFIKGLAHLLSKKFKYVIVADRGFGNQRFAKLCEENAFEYVFRINENLKLKSGNQITNLRDKNRDEIFNGYVVSWQANYHFIIATNADKIWYLISSNPKNDALALYEKRFKIEKNYQDCKSSGYDIEKNKIRKYDRFKRMLYLVVLAHALTCFIGDIIRNTVNTLKKNSTVTAHLNIKLILAFLESDTKPFLCTLRNPCICLDDSSSRS